MARTDRLLRLLQAMRVMAAPITATRLAQETGVSLRSLYRDIDALRASGARIEGERGYGYRLTEDYALPPQTFDRMEIEALALGLAEVLHMGNPALVKAAREVKAKVAATLPDDGERHLFLAVSQVYRLETRYPATPDLATPDLATIRLGCWQEQAVTIRYADTGGKVTQRTILPLAIAYLDRKLMVLAWCCLRQGFGMFQSDRISDAALAGESFRPRRVSMLRSYLADLRPPG